MSGIVNRIIEDRIAVRVASLVVAGEGLKGTMTDAEAKKYLHDHKGTHYTEGDLVKDGGLKTEKVHEEVSPQDRQNLSTKALHEIIEQSPELKKHEHGSPIVHDGSPSMQVHQDNRPEPTSEEFADFLYGSPEEIAERQRLHNEEVEKVMDALHQQPDWGAVPDVGGPGYQSFLDKQYEKQERGRHQVGYDDHEGDIPEGFDGHGVWASVSSRVASSFLAGGIDHTMTEAQAKAYLDAHKASGKRLGDLVADHVDQESGHDKLQNYHSALNKAADMKHGVTPEMSAAYGRDYSKYMPHNPGAWDQQIRLPGSPHHSVANAWEEAGKEWDQAAWKIAQHAPFSDALSSRGSIALHDAIKNHHVSPAQMTDDEDEEEDFDDGEGFEPGDVDEHQELNDFAHDDDFEPSHNEDW